MRSRKPSSSSSRASTSDRGSASTGRERNASRPARSRSSQRSRECRIRCRAWSTAASSWETSGTISLAASVGVEARTSATRSSSGLSGSWPIADTTGVRALATARISPSSENGSRSSTEPPPRAITITSTSAWWSSRSRAEITSAAARWPCIVACTTSNVTPGQRRVALSRTSRSAADRGAVTRPTRGGQERERPLQRGVEEPLGGQQLSAPLELGEQLAEADHPDLAGVERERAAVGVVGRLGVHDDAGALDQRWVEAVEERAAAGHRHRDVGHRVAQGHEHRLQPWPPAHLGDLSLDPDGAEAVDPARDRVRDRPDRRRRLG